MLVYLCLRRIYIRVCIVSLTENHLILNLTNIERNIAVFVPCIRIFDVEIRVVVIVLYRSVGLGVAGLIIRIRHNTKLVSIAKDFLGSKRGLILSLSEKHVVRDGRHFLIVIRDPVCAFDHSRVIGNRIGLAINDDGESLGLLAVGTLLHSQGEGLIAREDVRLLPPGSPVMLVGRLIFHEIGYDRLTVFGFERSVVFSLCEVVDFKLVHIRCLVGGLHLQTNIVRRLRLGSGIDNDLYLVLLCIRAVKGEVGLGFCDGVAILVLAIDVLPEVIAINGVRALARDLREAGGKVSGGFSLIEAHVAAIDRRIIVQFATCNVDALVIHELEFLVGINRMRELARTVCGSSLFWAHGDDLVRHELAVVVETHAEEVRALIGLHVVGIRVRLGIADVRFMLLVERHVDVMVDAIILLLFERRGHNVSSIIALVNLRRGRVEILRQVAALRATDRVLVVEDSASNFVLNQIDAQVVSASHDLRGDGLSLDAGVVHIRRVEPPGPIRLRVLVEDDWLGRIRRIL